MIDFFTNTLRSNNKIQINHPQITPITPPATINQIELILNRNRAITLLNLVVKKLATHNHYHTTLNPL